MKTIDGLGTIERSNCQEGQTISVVHPTLGRFSYLDGAIGTHGEFRPARLADAIGHIEKAMKILDAGDEVQTSRGTIYFIDEDEMRESLKAALAAMKGNP